MNFYNLIISVGGELITNGFDVHVSETLFVSGTIRSGFASNAGTGGSAGSGGFGYSPHTSRTNGQPGTAGVAGAGGTGDGGDGGGAWDTAFAAQVNGGDGGTGGDGGNGGLPLNLYAGVFLNQGEVNANGQSAFNGVNGTAGSHENLSLFIDHASGGSAGRKGGASEKDELQTGAGPDGSKGFGGFGGTVTILVSVTCYADTDGDGYGDPGSPAQFVSCPAGYSTDNTDCDDTDASINPGETEIICDGLDNDCNPATPDAPDVDGDGWTTCAGDCNDNDANIFPGATEVCNNIDDNCDTFVDEGVTNTYYEDADGDGYGNFVVSTQACSPPSGFVSDNTDCDDTDSSIFPGAVEVCNGIDDNCDGNIDEGVLTTYYQDLDLDGYGDPLVSVQACSQPPSFVLDSTDCNDSDINVNPSAAEVCNGIDDNCDGNIDEGVLNTYYQDSDGDGFGDIAVTTQDCSPPTGYVSDNTDCDDTDMNVNPGAAEVCNEVDDNCDGNIDEGVTNTYYDDADSDGFGNPASSVQACTAPPEFVSNNTNCDDTDSTIYPGAPEIPDDGIDQGCNGSDSTCCIGDRGDANNDGVDHNILDLTFLVDFMFRGGNEPECPEEADMNSDGTPHNILDLTFIVDYIFRGSNLPPSTCN